LPRPKKSALAVDECNMAALSLLDLRAAFGSVDHNTALSTTEYRNPMVSMAWSSASQYYVYFIYAQPYNSFTPRECHYISNFRLCNNNNNNIRTVERLYLYVFSKLYVCMANNEKATVN